MNRNRSHGGFLKRNAEFFGFGVRLLDLAAIVLGGVIAHYLRLDTITPELAGKTALLITLLGAMVVFPLFDLYKPWRGMSLRAEARTVVLAWLSVAAAGLILTYLTKTGTVYSRLWFGYWVLITISLLVGIRIVIRILLRWARRKGFNTRNVLIVGAGNLGKQITRHLGENDWTGMKVVGFLDDNPSRQGDNIDGVPVIGGTERLRELSKGGRPVINPGSQQEYDLTQIDQVWLALPLSAEAKIRQICRLLENATVSIIFVPDIFVHRLLNHSVDDLAGMPVVDLRASLISGGSRVLKLLEDGLVSVAACIFTAPLMLLIAIAIKLESSGPVLFRQRRYGIDGKEIVVWKFRTMRVTEDGDKIPQATKNDPRLTKIGTFLRKTSLDELPQFFNVLQGRMSVVGPRPHAVAHNEQYREIIERYMWRHKVKPGITGWAQVNGWRGETDTREKMEKRVEHDLEYLSNWSIWLDLKIIFQTVFKGFVNGNAY